MLQNIILKLRGTSQNINAIKAGEETIDINGVDYEFSSLPIDNPISGTVYGAFLNFKGAFEELEPLMHEPPYEKPPTAPILYMKPKNTFTSHGRPIPLPIDEKVIEIGASLGIVFNKTATKVKKEEALQYVLGYTIVNDVSIPHNNFHRPAVKEKMRDHFCPIGPWIVERNSVNDPNNLKINTYINGEIKQENSTENLIRSVETLIEDVTQFMTLSEGDVLLVGVPEKSPLAQENDLVTIEIEQIGKLENRVVAEKDVIGGVFS